MRKRRVIIPLSVRLYLDDIADHIVDISRQEHAVRYVHEMVAEISELSYLADSLPVSRSTEVQCYHPQAKRLNIKHGTWCVIFHTDGDYVIIDKILPSCMITH